MAKRIEGNLIISTLADAKKAAEVEYVGGYVDIRAEGAQLPVLASVGGYVDIRAEGAQLPVLASVGGYVYIRAEGAQLPVLASVGGSVDIRAEGAQLPVLASVGGSVYISAEGAQLPVLASVGGYVDIRAEGAQLPVLASVGGSVYISAEGAQLPVLASVGGYAVVSRDEEIANMDKLREIVLDSQGRLDMGHWHGDEGWRERTCAEEAVCGTTHCAAGWLQVCTPPDSPLRDAEAIVAGNVLAPRTSAAGMFFTENKRMLRWLQEREYAA